MQGGSKKSAEKKNAYLSIYRVEIVHAPGHFGCQQFSQDVHRKAV